MAEPTWLRSPQNSKKRNECGEIIGKGETSKKEAGACKIGMMIKHMSKPGYQVQTTTGK